MRPVWSFTLERTTNAPMGLVVDRLRDSLALAAWHPRHRAGSLEVVHLDDFRFEALHQVRPMPGVEEEGRYRVTREGDGLLLSYEGRFKGWPVLVMMGWWRISSDRLWERFVERLG